MLYQKPNIVSSAKAVEAIQGVVKCTQTHPDSSNPSDLNATIGAYEADE
jgi:hypothetical protein